MLNPFILIEENKFTEFTMLVAEDYSVLKLKNSDGQTPFYCALGSDKYDFVSYLLEKKDEDPNVPGPKDGLAALSYYVSVYKAQPMDKLVPMLELLLKHGAKVNHISPSKGTLLTLVSALNDAAFVDYVLDIGADVALTNSSGETALHAAARWSNSLEIIKCLVKEKSDIKAKTTYGRTVLMQAVEDELKPEFVRFLLAHGADIKAHDLGGNTALHIAIDTCTTISIYNKPTYNPLHQGVSLPSDPMSLTAIETLELLLKNGADLDQENNDGLTPRDMVHRIANDGVKRFLSKFPSTKNCFQLIKENKIKAFTKLVEADSSILKLKDSDDHTPFYTAVGYDKYDIVSYLLEKKGENPNEPGPKDDTAALSYYVFVYNARPMAELVPMLELLLKYGADINHISPSKGTLLSLVSALNDAKFVQYVLDKGADVALTDSSGETALHTAARWSNSLEIIQCLVKANSDIKAITNSGQTVLMQAVDGGLKPEFVRFLLENGADIKAKDLEGNTALHIAMETCTILSIKNKPTGNTFDQFFSPPDPMSVKEETVIQALELLLKHGADLDQENNKGLTPRDKLRHIANDGVKEFISKIPYTRTSNPIACMFSCFRFWHTFPAASSAAQIFNSMGQGPL